MRTYHIIKKKHAIFHGAKLLAESYEGTSPKLQITQLPMQ